MDSKAVCLLSRGDTEHGNIIINEILNSHKERGMSERAVERSLAVVYQDAGMLNEAEQHFRKSMRMYSNDAFSMFLLADFLIMHDRGVDEGLSLIDKAINSDSLNVLYIWRKGIGLYKKGQYKESLEFLEKAKKYSDAIVPELDKDIQKAKDAINNKI